MLNKLDPAAIYAEAVAAGREAAAEYEHSLPPHNYRGFDCGFAWVTIRPARGPFVNWCRKNGHGSVAYGGGWQFWYSKFSDCDSQSVGTHIRAATAFAGILKNHGIDSSVGSRLD